MKLIPYIKPNFVMYYVGILTILSSFAIIGVIVYWLTWPYEVIKLRSIAKPDKITYTKNDTIYYQVDYCKTMSIPATVTIQFLDGVLYTMPSFQTNNPAGCQDSKGTIPVPNIPSGEYRLKVTYVYEVNPIRTWTYTYETTPFQITN